MKNSVLSSDCSAKVHAMLRIALRSGICMNTFGMHEIKIHMRPETRAVPLISE